MFEPIQKFFPGAAQSFGLTKAVLSAQVCNKFNLIIPKIFKNPEAAQNLKAKSFSEKTLKISSSSSLWSQEITMRKEDIIRAVNSEFGQEVIKKLKIELNS